MTRHVSFFLKGILVSALIFAALFAVAGVSADTRDARDRGSTGRTVDLTPPPIATPTPEPATPPPPSVNQGGITSVTVGGVNTGGNTGGIVTTGDESVTVHEVNVGPTNTSNVQQEPPPPPPEESSAPAQQPTCETDARGRTVCTSPGTTGRTR